MQAFLDMLSKFFEVFEAGSNNGISFNEMIPEITDPYMIILIAVLFIIVGALQCFLGFKFFKVWCSFIGLLLGSIIGIGLFSFVPLGGEAAEFIRVFMIICVGLLCSFAAYRAYQVGVFLYAFVILFALCFIPLSGAFEQIMIAVIVGLCVGIAGGVVAVIVQRISIIVATCLSGGLAVATGVIMLMGDNAGTAVMIVPVLAALACAAPGFFVQLATTKEKPKAEVVQQPVVQVVVQTPAEAAAVTAAAGAVVAGAVTTGTVAADPAAKEPPTPPEPAKEEPAATEEKPADEKPAS